MAISTAVLHSAVNSHHGSQYSLTSFSCQQLSWLSVQPYFSQLSTIIMAISTAFLHSAVNIYHGYQTDTEDNHPILHKEVEAAVQLLKKGKLSWGRQHPSRTGPSRCRGCNHSSHDNPQQSSRQEDGQPHGPSP